MRFIFSAIASPFHAGHLIVKQDGIDVAGEEEFQSFGDAAGFENLVAILFEQHFARNETFPLVFNAENSGLGARHDFEFPIWPERIGSAA